MDDDRTPLDFAEYVSSDQQALLRLAATLTGSGAAAEELVADVLGRAFERWDRIGAVDRVGAYVRRMIVNEFISRRRRHRRIVLTGDLSVHEQAAVVPDHAPGYDDRAALRDRISRLPRRQRAALVLRYYEDLPDAEIAAALGCAVGTVRSLVSRALAGLRAEPDPPPDRPVSSALPALNQETI